MGYIRGFVHGAVAGTLIGLWVAPQSGERTRAQLRAFGKAARGGVDAAQRTAKQVAPVVGGAAALAREEVGRNPRGLSLMLAGLLCITGIVLAIAHNPEAVARSLLDVAGSLLRMLGR